ncbi:MAG: hypothetical protein GOV00_04165 [Candidatus Altiarchaeota archaeon]|nr:hypothetical protein [Candidatus Altiarchaeota archaeon]
MIEMTEDAMYHFFLVLALVSAIMVIGSLLTEGLVFNADPQALANYALEGVGGVLAQISGAW